MSSGLVEKCRELFSKVFGKGGPLYIGGKLYGPPPVEPRPYKDENGNYVFEAVPEEEDLPSKLDGPPQSDV